MSYRRILPGAVLGLSLIQGATADQIDSLTRYYTDVQSLSGEFVQETRDETGQLVEESRGTLEIRRPNRFRWHYETPFEQIIVADGQNLWVHDLDLEQVTVRPLDDILGTGAALLLSGRLADLESQFEIGTDAGWITLTPRNDGWEVESVRLRMSDGVPDTLLVLDGLGQESTLELNNLERNPDLAPERFEFRPPEGVDVIGDPVRQQGG